MLIVRLHGLLKKTNREMSTHWILLQFFLESGDSRYHMVSICQFRKGKLWSGVGKSKSTEDEIYRNLDTARHDHAKFPSLDCES
jgi:hypothetical protein